MIITRPGGAQIFPAAQMMSKEIRPITESRLPVEMIISPLESESVEDGERLIEGVIIPAIGISSASS